MKLIDMLVERSLVTSRKFVQAVQSVNNVFEEVRSLHVLVAHLAQHISMLQIQVNSLVRAHNNEAHTETKLPELDKRVPGEEKPN